MKLTKRDFLKLTGATVGAGVAASLLPGGAFGALTSGQVRAMAAAKGVVLSDPSLQPMFVEPAPNALSAPFKYAPGRGVGNFGEYVISVKRARHEAGLVDPKSGRRLNTTIYGYGSGDFGPTWPGRTLDINKNDADVVRDGVTVRWDNQLSGDHILPVDTSLHWCYSLPGYTQYSLKRNGVPMIPHVHGGHTDFEFDGNPEFFFSRDGEIVGPAWDDVEGGFTNRFTYDLGSQATAGSLWYHDHALGITRLNVYAGLAGFFFVRDQYDTGAHQENSLNLPGLDRDTGNLYEVALAIQDRYFTDKGEFFYPAYPGDPSYADFITGEGAALPPDIFKKGGPTALAEFFGDHMVVNGKIWPKMDVEPRNYRLRLLNGCDSRFLAVQFFEVPTTDTDFTRAVSGPLDFTVIGSDQGLASSPTTVDALLVETGSRYDIIVDFKKVTPGNRVIMKNIGGDEPFGGDIPGPQVFTETDRIMAFDVSLPLSSVPDATPTGISFGPSVSAPTRTRKVALFEGKDEFGRLQPLLGTAEPATDYKGDAIEWPDELVYSSVGLSGQMNGSIAWHSPTTENPELDTTEEWEIWNTTGDAHPVHLHLVHFQVLGRDEIKWDNQTKEDDRVLADEMAADGDGTYLVDQPTVQHNSVAGQDYTYGSGFKIVNPTKNAENVSPEQYPKAYVENAPKDMVTALPGQVTRIKAHFDKPGHYVWHCHILSHEDHEMMRVLHVGPGEA
jgi:spore coat protein A